jgi:hypothetical protein
MTACLAALAVAVLLHSGPAAWYGTPEATELFTLATGTRSGYAAATKGHLSPLDGREFFELSDGGARVLVVVVPELREGVRRLSGRRVEVVGYVRQLEQRQGVCEYEMRTVPVSVCDDPLLPPKPDLAGRTGWPPMSITIWSIGDITPLGGGQRGVADSSALFAAPGERVVVVGRFGGANLERTLHTAAPTPQAWVLQVGGEAIWVVDKPPRGDGWRFDRDYEGDVGKWLEVEGRIARCGTTPCLKARRVSLAPKPAEHDSLR